MFKEFTQLAGLMRQAQGMAEGLKDVQQKLAELRLTGQAGDGLVAVDVTGQGRIVDCRIDSSLLHPEHKTRLEQLVVIATNDAHEQVRQAASGHFNALTGGLGLGDVLSKLGGFAG
jgi:DNA-binding YbaB/EbfC family protein